MKGAPTSPPLACLVVLWLGLSSAAAQQVRDAPPVTGRAAIRGRIIGTDSGQGIRGATVRISAPELRGMRTAVTGVDGRYEIRNLPAGRYSINASKSAYISWSYGQSHSVGRGTSVAIADNQVVDEVDIRLPRGGVITGHITDEFGEPVPNASVALLRQQFQQGRRRLTQAGGRAMTNDIGEYRLFGLAPGQYYVSATAAHGALGAAEESEPWNGYAPTFYPGTADPASAQKLTVGLAQGLSEINILLSPTRLATISGMAFDSKGHRLTGGSVAVMSRAGAANLVGGGGPIRSDGTFAVPNLAPGEYVVRATVQRSPAAGIAPLEFSVAFVVVNGEDIRDVQLTPVPPVIVSGRISFDDPNAARSLKPSAVRVITQDLDGDTAIGFGGQGADPPQVHDDFTFALKTLPGRIALRAAVASGAGALSGWQVKAISINGLDVTDNGIDVNSQGVRGVDIELTNRLQQISGAVTDSRGAAVKDCTVVVFARDRSRWTAAFDRYFALSRPGDDGRFKVATLPSGQYYAIALDRVDATESQNPEFLEGLTGQATPFSLAEGGSQIVDLRLFTVQ